jgi:hypothetical protein
MSGSHMGAAERDWETNWEEDAFTYHHNMSDIAEEAMSDNVRWDPVIEMWEDEMSSGSAETAPAECPVCGHNELDETDVGCIEAFGFCGYCRYHQLTCPSLDEYFDCAVCATLSETLAGHISKHKGETNG